jgi:hypothetical protein
LERYLSVEHRPREELVVVDALAKDERRKEEEHRYLESKVLEGRVTVELGSGQQLQFTMSGMSSLSPTTVLPYFDDTSLHLLPPLPPHLVSNLFLVYLWNYPDPTQHQQTPS